MSIFEQLERARALLNESEYTLRGARDQVGREEQQLINQALQQYLELRDQLWIIDNAIAGGVDEKNI